MRATSLRLGQLVNQTGLGRDAALPQPTVHRWLNLLETSYLLVRLPAYAVNRTQATHQGAESLLGRHWRRPPPVRGGRAHGPTSGKRRAARSARVARCPDRARGAR